MTCAAHSNSTYVASLNTFSWPDMKSCTFLFPLKFSTYNHVYLLPPANEVWGKVIFSQASVILSKRGLASQHASQVTGPRGLHLGGCIRGSASTRGACIRGVWTDPPKSAYKGVCIWGGLSRPLPLRYKRAARILLECFLVRKACGDWKVNACWHLDVTSRTFVKDVQRLERIVMTKPLNVLNLEMSYCWTN